jgi:hypothetical protein
MRQRHRQRVEWPLGVYSRLEIRQAPTLAGMEGVSSCQAALSSGIWGSHRVHLESRGITLARAARRWQDDSHNGVANFGGKARCIPGCQQGMPC